MLKGTLFKARITIATVKKIWNNIQLVMPSKTKRTNINLVDAETQRPLSREYFATIGQRLAKDISDILSFDGVTASTTMDVIKTKDEEVKKIRMNIDVSKASSASNLSSAIPKDAFLVIIPQLTYMFNQSFAEVSFPTSWKQARVIPLPGKMAERIVHTRMGKYLEDNNLLNEKQGGRRSTLSQNLQMIFCWA